MKSITELREKFRKLNINDWKVLILFYNSSDWESVCYTIKEVEKTKKLTHIQARHILTKLKSLELIDNFKSFLSFYHARKDKELRKLIESEYSKLMKSLFGVEE